MDIEIVNDEPGKDGDDGNNSENDKPQLRVLMELTMMIISRIITEDDDYNNNRDDKP